MKRKDTKPFKKAIIGYSIFTAIMLIIAVLVQLSCANTYNESFGTYFSQTWMLLLFLPVFPFIILLVLCIIALIKIILSKIRKTASKSKFIPSSKLILLKRFMIWSAVLSSFVITILISSAAFVGMHTYNYGPGFYSGFNNALGYLIYFIIAAIAVTLIFFFIYSVFFAIEAKDDKASQNPP